MTDMASADNSEVQRLLDRQAILDVVYRYCRGLDRCDFELLRSCFHPDAIDQDDDFIRGVDEFVSFAREAMVGRPSHTHYVTSHFCELDGDVADAESYVIAVELGSDTRANGFGGRYFDHFARRNSEWRIASRRVMRDWRFDADASQFVVREAADTDDSGFPLGRRDRQDLSYHRPLPAPTGAKR